MATKTSFKLSKTAQANVISYLQSRYTDFPLQTIRDRLEKIDRALQLESELRRKDRKDYFQDTEIATARPSISKLANFLTDLFVGNRIFEVVSSDPGNAKAVKQFNAVIEENSKSTGWARELILFLRDVSKYPYAIISVEWMQEQILEIISDSTLQTSNSSGAATEITGRQGNKLTRWCPYNSFYDTSVPANRMHLDGEFTGHIERLSQVEVFKRITNLKAGDASIMNEKDIWGKATTTPQHYYFPDVKPAYELEQEGNTGFDAFFSTSNNQDDKRLESLGKGARYEWVTLNARIIPEIFGFNVPGANKLQLWKFYIINWDTVVFAEKQTNAHSYMSSVMVQITEEGLREQSKSMAELVVPVQNLSTSLHDTHLASLKRAIGDRALYDSNRIDESSINSTKPDAKIPVRPNMIKNATLQDAYYSIPFNNSMSQGYYQELGFLERLSEGIVGINKPQQGQFQKGNKTLGEFNEVMNNADDDLRTYAKILESVGFHPIKMMIKTNIMQYQPPTTIASSTEEETVTVNPVELRRASMQFKVADGLVDKSQLLDLPTANNLLNLVLQVPALQQQKDIVKLVDHIMGSVGFDTSQFNNQQQPQGQPPATLPAGDNTNGQ